MRFLRACSIIRFCCARDPVEECSVFPAFALAVLLGVCSGCGGGAVQVHEADGGLRPAGVHVRALEEAKTQGERRSYLDKIRDQYGRDLDWADFWSLLENSSAKNLLLQEEPTALLQLSALDCRSEFFLAFVEFAVNNHMGGEWIFGPERRCDVPVGGEIANRILDTFLEAGASVEASKAILVWLSREVEADASSHVWRESLSQRSTWKVRRAAEKLLLVGEASVVSALDQSFSRVLGTSPVAGVFDSYLVRSAPVPDLFAGLDLVGALRSLGRSVDNLSPVQLQAHTVALAEHFLGKNAVDPGEFTSHLLQLSHFVYSQKSERLAVQLMSNVHEITRASLRLRDSLYRGGVASHVEAFFAGPLAPYQELTLIWLALELASQAGGETSTGSIMARNRLQYFDTRDLSSVLSILYLRNRLYSATEAVVFNSISKEYCQELTVAGFYGARIPASKLKADTAPGGPVSWEPGCYLVVDLPAVQPIHVGSLRFPLDSILTFPSVDLKLRGGAFSAGWVRAGDIPLSNLPPRRSRLEFDFDQVSLLGVWGFDRVSEGGK